MSLHIDIHIIQSVPPSNINRDDTGSPKTATYGGVRRARVSSQAWKRATRRGFQSELDTADVGVRTKHAAQLVAERVKVRTELDDATALQRATEALGQAGFKTKAARKAQEGDPQLTEYLVFFSNAQLDQLADLIAEADGAKIDAKAAKKALDTKHSFDVALFGRMVANDTTLNVDAACQVAHAISTHGVETEFDYYTAVDDQEAGDEERTDAGAGMVGTIEFDSATLYRYATVNVDALKANLGDARATVRALEAFIRSFALSMPTGKSNTFANQTVPDAVVVMARTDRAVSLVGAFEEPVRDKAGFVAASTRALAQYAADLESAYGRPAARTWITRVGARTSGLEPMGTPVPLDELVEGVGAFATEALDGQP